MLRSDAFSVQSHGSGSTESADAAACPTLRLMSYNIQTGISISGYHHYVTHSWKHLLPYPERSDTLDQIGRLISDYDIVALQEVDAGSLRTGFINQTKYLGSQAAFPYWFDQTNRRLGKLAQHSIGLLSRFRPLEVSEHKLPGIIPGRGGLIARLGEVASPLVVMVVHLAIGKRARMQQLRYISELAGEYEHIIVMGDMNCRSDSDEMDWFLAHTSLREPTQELHTYPSWRPWRNIDHILVSRSLRVARTRVLNYPFSDHLPICMDVVLPRELSLEREEAALSARNSRPLQSGMSL